MTYPPQQPQWKPGQQPPEYWLRQQAQQQGYPPPPPQLAVTRRPLSPIETLFHLVMTCVSCGVWGFIWWSRVRGRRQITRYR